MPPRPSSPTISYLPALVAVIILLLIAMSLLPRMDEKRLTLHVRAVFRRGQCPPRTSVSQSPRAELRIAAVPPGNVASLRRVEKEKDLTQSARRRDTQRTP